MKLIYAVDDEESIRDVYSYALSGAGFQVKCFSCSEELFSALKERIPDLLLLDVMLDGVDGYGILGKIRSDSSTENLPVIMVSAKTTEIDRVKGLNLGADDYLCKPFGILELVARINAKLRKSEEKKDKITYKDVSMDESTRTVTVCGKETPLTLKQYELLKILLLNSEKVVKRDTLLDKVWGENYGETRTLDIHIGDLRKLLAGAETQIATVRGVGYMLK